MRRWVVVASVALQACAPASTTPKPTEALTEPRSPWHAKADPTVHGARLVPDSLDLSKASIDASGTVQGIVQGVRFQSRTRGSLRTADDRIDDPSQTLFLPPRLSGGVLFVVGNVVYRADDWLTPASPIFRGSPPIDRLFVGLDRVYVRLNSGAHLAIDPRSGALLDLGPWPLDPVVGDYVALDGWRAVALANVSGAVGTLDAGRTWTRLEVPIRGRSAVGVRHDAERDRWTIVTGGVAADAIVVSDAPLPAPTPVHKPHSAPSAPRSHCYLVTADLDVSPLESCEQVAEEAPRGEPHASLEASRLREAVADGWPLADGSALVAADGNLSRVSLADGQILETTATPFGADLGRCHAVSLAQPAAPAAFGFVCGAASGSTALFAYDESIGHLRPVRAFATPRVVQVGAHGSWLVRGSCDDPATPGSFCVGEPSASSGVAAYSWREAQAPEAPGAAALLNAQGDLVLADPPGVSGARLVVTKRDGTSEALPLHVSESTTATRRFLTRAMWQGGLEERSPGIYSGWLAGDGTVVGAQIDASGDVRLGSFIRELGSPFVAGRYGVSFARTQVGYETVDGGMTWTTFHAPLPIGPSTVRACGPSGCVADGWIRVGWGGHAREPEHPTVFPLHRGRPVPSLPLVCRALETPVHHVAPAPPTKPARTDPRVTFTIMGLSGTWTASGVSSLLNLADRTEEWFKAPPLGPAESFVKADAYRARDDGPRLGPVGRVYAWGPSKGDWSGVGRWVARWRSPFSGSSVVVSSAVAPAPFHDLESARTEFAHPNAAAWTATVSEDGAHALFMTHPNGRSPELTAIDEHGSFAPVVRVDGEPWGLVDSAVRIGSDWFLASPLDAQRDRLEVLRADAGGARRLAVLERKLYGLPPETVRLARSESGSLVGVLVEGEPPADGLRLKRWVIPVSLESGETLAPEPLGMPDLSDRDEVPVCTDGAGAGWVVEAPWPDANVTIALGPTVAPVTLHSVLARFRVSSDRACVERLAADISEDALASLASLASVASRSGIPGSGKALDAEPSLPMVVATDEPIALRCSVAAFGRR